ncbi:hypothetical protein NADFUDRAFT_45099 [Nadsonia fulvescens var. elongata DSM 6958]|uniref:Branchpoint-bridging protein n=1 Tax=Nadsonia fulvescens var. elongata DSM 6958 TaxID=857566 RepID=A0A1E3PT32_9ASCO|nr:hypothetical protein NADFUDRAFT_45099 [Nadsonia fulvescens var. elongata DSM 6958]
MTPEQIEAYALSVRIEEISSKLKLNDVVPRDGERSPSPPPEYDQQGKRLNTREVRYRQKLEDERHKLISKAFQVIPNFKPPADYRKPQKTQEKIYIPVNDYPEINFIGLIIGPRGNTLKNMEIDSGAKIAVRGKGSVKEGKGRTDVPYQHSMDDDLHCLITSDSEEKIQKAIDLINKIIETAASVPEGQNDLKRGQLRELASLNGTLRDDEAITCPVCGETGHKRYDCPHKKNFTNSLICRICGGQGHFARDCKERPNNYHSNNYHNNNRGMITSGANSTAADREYEQLMQELGAPSSTNRLALENGPYGPSSASGAAPWMKPASGGPAPWASQAYDNSNYGNNNNNQQNGYDSRDGGYNGRSNNYSNNSNYERRGGYGNNDRRGGYNNNQSRRGGFGGNDRQSFSRNDNNDRQFNRYDNNNRDNDNRGQQGGYRRDNADRGGMNNYNDRRGGYNNRNNYDGGNGSRSNHHNNGSNDNFGPRQYDNNSSHDSSHHNGYNQGYSQHSPSSSSYQSQSMPAAPPTGPLGSFPMPPGMSMIPNMPAMMNSNNESTPPGPPGMPPSFKPPPPPPSNYKPPPPSSYPPPPPPNY